MKYILVAVLMTFGHVSLADCDGALSGEQILVLAKKGEGSDLRFGKARLRTKKEPRWNPIIAGGRKAWSTRVTLRTVGSLEKLTAKEKAVLKERGAVDLVAISDHPPGLVGRWFEVLFENYLNEYGQTVNLYTLKGLRPIAMVFGNEMPEPATAADFHAWPMEDRAAILNLMPMNFVRIYNADLKLSDPLFAKVALPGTTRVEVLKHIDGTVLGGTVSNDEEDLGVFYIDDFGLIIWISTLD